MEINYGLTGGQRKELVNVISDILQTRPKYAGMPTCAYQIGEFTVTKEGNLAWDETTTDGAELMEKLKDKGYGTSNNDELVISIPKDALDEEGIKKLQNLVDSKGSIMKHAFLKDELKIEVDEEKISFPWFDLKDDEHVTAYSQFITAITKMAKEQKRILNREKEVENEKYAFRCFLSELPKSGTLNGKYNFNKLQKVLELHTFLLAKHSKMCYNF